MLDLFNWWQLTLLSAAALGGADLLTRAAHAKTSIGALTRARFILPGLLLAPLLLLAPPPPLPLEFWVGTGILIPLEIAAMWFYVLALRAGPMVFSLPYLAFTPVFNLATGWLLLGETLSLGAVAGVLFVVLGAYLLNLGQVGPVPTWRWLIPLQALARERASQYMLLVALLYSVTSVLGKKMMLYTGPITFAALYFLLLGAVLLIPALLARRGPEPERADRHAWLVGLLMAVMILTHFLAIAEVQAAAMVAVKRTSMLFGILLGWWWLRERPSGRQLGAALIMLAGVVTIVSTT